MILRRKTLEYREGISGEWLVANGVGGYASSTIIGVNTRKYHGLLVAPLNPPWQRRLFLAKLEEEINIGEKKFRISSNKYPEVVYPKGHEHLKEFNLSSFPTFLYSFGMEIRKTIFMPHQRNAVIIAYEVLKAHAPGRIRIYPLVNSRGIHEVTKAKQFEEHANGKAVTLSYRQGMLLLGSDCMRYTGSGLLEEAKWYRNMEYEREKERGYEYLEDHYCPGFFELDVKEGSQFHILAAGGFNAEETFRELYSEKPKDYEVLMAKEEKRLKSISKGAPRELEYLARASDSFLVSMGTGKGIIAGYHWFSTWGRDSMISLPGICLVTKQYKDAKLVLKTLASYCKNGLIPNLIDATNGSYNSVDSSLWFIYAVHKYLTYTGDTTFVKELWPKIREILEAYAEGNGEALIRADEDGLISAGDEGTQLTWMDAKIGSGVVTPRHGKAVEINALWYNALKTAELLSREFGGDASNYMELSRRVREGFKAFWNPEKKCLYDVIRNEKDASVRPNQIFAVSLPFRLLSKREERAVVSRVQEELLTPYGLRSLSPNEEGYIGRYSGSPTQRDAAYHQGTVWSWLLGPFVTALLRTENYSASSREDAKELLDPILSKHLQEAGLGTVSEIFDGSPPYLPRGCISQAWSVGELLRCYVEDIMLKRPEYEEDWL
ncbi:MAG: amylo-alpha-1,6-glucosidase [Candidatus Hydrothermarchaeales archaeon]